MEDEYFIIWTTTPWTIPFNLAIMVNPELDYVRAKVNTGEKEESWIICKDLAGVFLSNVDEIAYEIEEEFKGADLEGMQYEHPWAKDNPDIKELQEEVPKLFTILLSSEYVDSSAGSGLVHCAPGCGPEDYEVGHRNGIPPYNVINEKGEFPDRIEKYKGLVAKRDDKEFIKMMKEDGFLIKKSPIEHDYPHCERCHNPIVFRTTKQWFFKTEDLKEKMLKFNKDVNWHPQTAKNAFNSWLDNLRDNSITKQRFWGTPAPIWVHRDENGDIDEYHVVGSIEEMKKLGGDKPDNIHKPWIDNVKIKHPETGTELERIPDVLDVWIDAGCACWASLYYPKKEEQFKEYFPADYIIEGKDQIRGWFNLLMVASALAFDKVPFKNVGMHGFLSGVDGVKMSKSLGNVISPQEIIDKSSVDNFRYYFTQSKAGDDLSFSWDQANLNQRHLNILWNTHKFLLDLVENSKNLVSLEEALELGGKHMELEENYVKSKVHSTLKSVTEKFESYKSDEIPGEVGELFLSISRDYIKAVRDKANSGDKEQVSAVIHTLYRGIMTTTKMFAPICPFITEMIYQNMKELGTDDFKEESVHHNEWPKYVEKAIDLETEKAFEDSLGVLSGLLAAREKAVINVRQPIQKAIVVSMQKGVADSIDKTRQSLLNQSNIKEIDAVEDFDKLTYNVKPNYKELGRDFGQDTSKLAEVINTYDKNKAKQIKELFDEKKDHVIELDGNPFEIKERHVEFDIEVEEPYVLVQSTKGLVVLDVTMTDELLNEGLSREFMRRIQNERKNKGMVKSDEISLSLDNKEFYDRIKDFEDQIKSVCGIKELTVGSGDIELDIKTFKVKISFL